MDCAFSAIIPLYNKGPHVERAIRSVQRAPGRLVAEIIVVDDGSIDEGPEVVRDLAREDGRIRLVHQENAGVSVARNRGAELAGCPYLLFLDADDEWTESFVPAIASLVARFPECNVFATAYTRQWPGRQPLRMRYHAVPRGPDGGVLPCYFACYAGGAIPLCSSTVGVARQALLDAGGFPPGVTHSEDRILWARLASSGKMAWHPAVGAVQHMGSVNQSLRSWHPHKIKPYLDELNSYLSRDDISWETKQSIRKLINQEHANFFVNCIKNKYWQQAIFELRWLINGRSRIYNMIYLSKLILPYKLKRPIRKILFMDN